jgi:signal transduction histidine kinase
VNALSQLSIDGPADRAEVTATAVSRFVLHLGTVGAAGLREALEVLVAESALSSAVVRRHDGVLAALAGDAHLAVSRDRTALDPVDVLALPIPGPGGTIDAQLLVTGATSAQTAPLALAASVIGLALSGERYIESDVFMAAEQDRDELADQLHDGPVQQLVFARYAADAAVRGGDPREARDAVQGALVEIRRYLWHLRPRGADLHAALDELSGRLAEAGHRVLGLSVHPGADALKPSGAALAYRLVQAVVLAGTGGQPPLGVVLRRHDDGVVVAVDGTLPRIDRWQRRARALGGSLSTTPDGLRLALPVRVPHPLDVPTHPAAREPKAIT